MGRMEEARRSRAKPPARSRCTRSGRVGRAERSLPQRPLASESKTNAEGGGRGEQAVASSPQQRAALHSLAYAYRALLQKAHPEYDWTVEVPD